MDTLVEAVKAHAVKHYENGGWDVIVECWSDENIRATIGDAQDEDAAIEAVETVVDVFADRQADARNSAF